MGLARAFIRVVYVYHRLWLDVEVCLRVAEAIMAVDSSSISGLYRRIKAFFTDLTNKNRYNADVTLPYSTTS